MEIRNLNKLNFFKQNKKKIKYKLLSNKKYIITTRNSLLQKNKVPVSNINNNSYIKIKSKTPRKPCFSRNLSETKLATNNNNILENNKKSFDHNYNIFQYTYIKEKNKQIKKNNSTSNIKNELYEHIKNTRFKIFCKIIGNYYNNMNDIDCVLQCPHKGVEKIDSIATKRKSNTMKRAISGYNIKPNSKNKIYNPLIDISKKSGISSGLIRKVIDYSLNHGVEKISKIIKEKAGDVQISNGRKIYLKIPLRNKNSQINGNIIDTNKTFNHKNKKDDLIYFDSFLPEDYIIKSKERINNKS